MPSILERLREAAEYAKRKKAELSVRLTEAAGGEEAVDQRAGDLQEKLIQANDLVNRGADKIRNLPVMGPYTAEQYMKAVNNLRAPKNPSWMPFKPEAKKEEEEREPIDMGEVD